MTVANEQITDSGSNYSRSGLSITLKRLGEIYESEDDEHGSEKVISAAILVDRLQWFNQA